ncbi:hypothetical protein V2J09_012697 [Rumex salicifolius]
MAGFSFCMAMVEQEKYSYGVAIRSRGEIGLTVASSGIAALLISGGRTVRSRFVIPIQIHEDSTYNIKLGIELSELISKAKVIIWDEAPMVNKEFLEWILKIRDGDLGGANDGETTIEIPSDLLITVGFEPIQTIVEAIYPSILNISDPTQYYRERAILASTHEIVDNVNDHVLSLLPGDEKVYLSSDSICKTDEGGFVNESVYSVDFLNGIRSSGVPNHVLKLKVGVPIMILRNIDQSAGLCNGTMLIVTLPWISKKTISGGRLFCHDNKQESRIVSLLSVGLFLPKPVFNHSQLYVAVSRVTSRRGLKILFGDRQGCHQNTTTNVVYNKVFQYIT